MGLEERSEEDFCIGRFGLRQLRGKNRERCSGN